MKSRTIFQLHEKNIAKKVGLYYTRFSDQMALFEIVDPIKGPFYFLLQPTPDDLSLLPRLEINDYRNPNPVYCPALNYAAGFLHNNFPIKPKKDPQPAQKPLLDSTLSIKVDQKSKTQLPLQQPARIASKRPTRWKQKVFACSYLDSRKPLGPFF